MSCSCAPVDVLCVCILFHLRTQRAEWEGGGHRSLPHRLCVVRGVVLQMAEYMPRW